MEKGHNGVLNASNFFHFSVPLDFCHNNGWQYEYQHMINKIMEMYSKKGEIIGMRLQNKVAVVTGAASGMGKAIAVLYAKEGAKVVVSDINLDAANQTVEEIKSNGGEAIVVLANVSKEEDIQNLIDTTVSTYGTLDILVNNAGIMDSLILLEILRMIIGKESSQLIPQVLCVRHVKHCLYF